MSLMERSLCYPVLNVSPICYPGDQQEIRTYSKWTYCPELYKEQFGVFSYFCFILAYWELIVVQTLYVKIELWEVNTDYFFTSHEIISLHQIKNGRFWWRMAVRISFHCGGNDGYKMFAKIPYCVLSGSIATESRGRLLSSVLYSQ